MLCAACDCARRSDQTFVRSSTVDSEEFTALVKCLLVGKSFEEKVINSILAAEFEARTHDGPLLLSRLLLFSASVGGFPCIGVSAPLNVGCVIHIQAADSSGDGTLSKEEFRQAARSQPM